MKTLAKMYRGQYRAVEDALDAWKADHDEATSVRDLEIEWGAREIAEGNFITGEELLSELHGEGG